MTIVIDKKMSAKMAKEKIMQLQKKKQYDAFSFLGKVKKWGDNGVSFQKKVRNEW